MSLLVVGSVAFDALETPFGKVDRTLGGAATYFSVAASFFTHVNLVGVVGDDFSKKDESIFKGRRIDISGLERAEGKTFFWAGRYGIDPERPRHADDGTERIRDVPAADSRSGSANRATFFWRISIPRCSVPCWSRLTASRTSWDWTR